MTHTSTTRTGQAPHLPILMRLSVYCVASVSAIACAPHVANGPTIPPAAMAPPAETVRAFDRIEPEVTWPNPYLQNVEREFTVTCPASLHGAAAFIGARLQERQRENPHLRVDVEYERQARLRLIVRDARSLVLTNQAVWELLYVTVTLTPTEIRLADRIVATNDPVLANVPPNSDFARALQQQRYEASVIVSGRYKAGGRPAALRGYSNDFERDNYTPELQRLASNILTDVKAYFHSKRQSYDTAGRSIVLGRDLFDNCS